MVQLDKFRQREIDLRRQRMATQLANSKTRVQYQLENQGIYNTPPPSAMQTDYETESNDISAQLKQANDNVNNLLTDKNQAAQLLNLITENNLVTQFNSSYPKIYREVKTNYGKIGAQQAYNIIIEILNGNDKPVNKQQFEKILDNMYKAVMQYQTTKRQTDYMKKIIDISSVVDIDDLVDRIEATKQTYDNLDDLGKKTLLSDFDDYNEVQAIGSILKMSENYNLNNVYNQNQNVLTSSVNEDNDGRSYTEFSDDYIINAFKRDKKKKFTNESKIQEIAKYLDLTLISIRNGYTKAVRDGDSDDGFNYVKELLNMNALPNDVIYSFTKGSASFGGLIVEKPSQILFTDIIDGRF